MLGGHSESSISGDKTENGIGYADYWILKVDFAGNIEWQNTIGGPDVDNLYSIIQTVDGGYLLGGSSDSDWGGDKFEYSNGEEDFWIVKTDSVGNIQWQNTIGGLSYDILTSLIQTPDGGYLLGGSSYSDISGDKSENSKGGGDFWIIKINAVGNIIWQKTIGGSGSDQLISIVQNPVGGYLLGGYSSSNASGNKNENSRGGYDYWIININANGNINWQRTIGGNDDDMLTSVILTSDNGFLLGGYSSSTISGEKIENSVGLYDYWIVKVDQGGNIQWQNTIGGSNIDLLSSIVQTSDNGYFLGGLSRSNISGAKTENSNGLYDYWMIKTDSAGIIRWQNTIGGIGEDWMCPSIESINGGIVLGGYSRSDISFDKTENSNGNWDFWIVKITSNFNQIQGAIYADLNSNQTQEPSEPSIPYLKITENNSNRFTFSQPNGFYNLTVLDTGNFEVAPDFVNLFNPVPLTHTGNFSSIQQIDSLNDFAFQPTGTFNDLCISISPLGNFRSGFNANYALNYSNLGTTTLIPTIVFYPDNNVRLFRPV